MEANNVLISPALDSAYGNAYADLRIERIFDAPREQVSSISQDKLDESLNS